METSTNREIIVAINDAFSRGSTEGFLAHCADDVSWTMMGKPAIVGKEAIRNFMSGMQGSDVPTFTFRNIIAEGDMVACDGSMAMTQTSGKPYHASFCDVYRFSEGKIKEMRSYLIETQMAQ